MIELACLSCESARSLCLEFAGSCAEGVERRSQNRLLQFVFSPGEFGQTLG